MTIRAVIDTNVVIAGFHGGGSQSPNREIRDRWRNGEFEWLYSRDTLGEYAKKLLERDLKRTEIQSFLARLILAGEEVRISFFHESVYPGDPDDIAFLLCATNGSATHLVTYDSDFEPVRGRFDFQVCAPISFLADLRSTIANGS